MELKKRGKTMAFNLFDALNVILIASCASAILSSCICFTIPKINKF
jgi:hypothetical protein